VKTLQVVAMLAGIASALIAVVTFMSKSSTAPRHRDTPAASSPAPATSSPASPARSPQAPAAPRAQDPGERPAQKK
jgi:hypothetical protein